MNFKNTVKGRVQLGVQAYADALLVIPKTLAQNAGFDPQDTIVKLTQEHVASKQPVGLDIDSGEYLHQFGSLKKRLRFIILTNLLRFSGEPINPQDSGIFDNYNVKHQILNSW